jgi:hypothetical protein
MSGAARLHHYYERGHPVTNAARKMPESSMLSRLRSAAAALQDAADDAYDAISEIRPDFGSDDDEDFDELNELPGIVRRHHDSDHEGPFQWCGNPVCRHVFEAELS